MIYLGRMYIASVRESRKVCLTNPVEFFFLRLHDCVDDPADAICIGSQKVLDRDIVKRLLRK